jgi:hypothetical protein
MLNNATFSLGSSTGLATIGTADPWLASAATTATLGPALLIQQTGKFAAIDANATTPIAGYGLSDTLVNQGSITGAFAGGTLTLGGAGLFINQGSIAVSNADTLVMDTAGFSNTGSITISGGATAILGGPPNAFGQSPAWSNTGQITLNGGSLVLSGLMQTAQLGHITDIAGGITLAGTLANAGATLSLGTPGMLATLSLTGTIQGGTIADPAGLLSAGTAGTALLDGVTDTGALALTQAGAWLRIRNFLTLNGSAEITGAGAVLGFQGSQIFNNAQIMLGAAGQAATLDVLHDSTTAAPSTLTLGAGLTIAQAGALAAIGASTDTAGDGITSYATITAATAGGTLALGGSNFINRGRIQVSNAGTLALTAAQFTNTGTIAITNASLDIADSLSTASLGSLTLTNAAIAIGGTLANTGTLAIGAGSAWGRLSLTGTITGGTIADSGGGLNAAGGATLNGVAYQGLLDLSRPFQQLATENGLAVTNPGGSGAGTIMLTGAASRLLATSSETLNNATIYLGSPTQTYYGQPIAPPELAASAGTTLTLGAGLKIQSAGLVGWLGNFATGNWTDAIVNDGTILAATAQGILTLGSSAFTNAGGLSIGNGGNIMFAGVSMQNTGNISLAAGSSLMLSLYGYYAAPNAGPTVFTNSGTLHMLGGAFQELTGNGLFPSVAIVNAAGGLIQGLGNILAPIVNNGTIEGKFGPNLSITGAITGTGTLQVDAGCVLELGNAVTASQTLAFTGAGETARLDDPQFFAAHVTGFTSGDTIDMAGSQINTVAVSAGTLVLGTTYGQFRLATTTPLGGEFSVGADTHGGDLVSYVQQTPGSGGAGGGTITTIAVTQPKMLFWASPVGDVFTGASAAMQGANIANWTAADSLDITDLLGAQTRIAYAQATGQGTITVTDGSHTDTVTLLGNYNASWFHVTPDAHGGALVTYSQT